MRAARARDTTEPAIVKALRAIGCFVLQCDHPDLIVGYRQRTFLLEVKSPQKRTRLQPSQVDLFERWRGGPLAIVCSVEEALDLVTCTEGSTDAKP